MLYLQNDILSLDSRIHNDVNMINGSLTIVYICRFIALKYYIYKSLTNFCFFLLYHN